MLDIACSAGTYVRSLGRDLGESLGTGAVMSALVRTAVGPFTLHTAVAPGDLARDNFADFMQPPLAAVESLPRVALSPEQVQELEFGRPIEVSVGSPEALVVAVDAVDEMLALLHSDDEGRFWPKVNFVGRSLAREGDKGIGGDDGDEAESGECGLEGMVA